MDEESESLLSRRQILLAYEEAIDRPEELLRVCAQVSGSSDAARAAVAQAFNVSELGARAILDMQVRRFTPLEMGRVREERAVLENQLRTKGWDAS